MQPINVRRPTMEFGKKKIKKKKKKKNLRDNLVID